MPVTAWLPRHSLQDHRHLVDPPTLPASLCTLSAAPVALQVRDITNNSEGNLPPK